MATLRQDVFALISLLICVACIETPPTGIDACTHSGDDHIDGYTSLLQESLSLTSHQTARIPLATGRDHRIRAILEKASTEEDVATLHSDNILPSPAPRWQMVGKTVLIAGGAAVLMVLLYLLVVVPHLRHAAAHNKHVLQTIIIDHSNTEEIEHRVLGDFELHSYNVGICIAVLDLYALASGKGEKSLRITRITFASLLVLITIFMQVATLYGTKHVVTPQQVASIRDSYDQYQVAMYGEAHTYLNKNGRHRGIAAFFNASAFADLDGDLQANICNIPFSQLRFLCCILGVWSLTCFAQIRQSVETSVNLILFTKTISSMADSLEECEDDDEGSDASDINDGNPNRVVTGLTLWVKLLLIFFVFIPDLGSTAYCLWLGSRWLAATNDFVNMMGNAVALEFILMLKNVIAFTLVSARNKNDLEHFHMQPPWTREPLGYGNVFITLLFPALACIWVYSYIYHFQQVLPDYKWDVHNVCASWLSELLSPSADA